MDKYFEWASFNLLYTFSIQLKYLYPFLLSFIYPFIQKYSFKACYMKDVVQRVRERAMKRKDDNSGLMVLIVEEAK